MDQNTKQSDNSFKNILNAKIIFVVLGLVVAAELIWAGTTLYKSSAQTVPQRSVSQTPAVLSLKADKSSVKVGEKIAVSINVSSVKKTVGTDVIIIFDPKVLSVEATGSPVLVGTLYKDYPLNALDGQNGKVTVSGITDQKGGIVANGTFGSLVFTAKLSGKTTVSLDFTPGKTTDSNVIESATGKDILGSVGNLEINVLP